MNASGFSFVYPFFMSMLIFGGSLEHLFYGLSMLDKFKGLGWKKYYLIFGMCDETFSINYTSEIPEDIDRGWFYWIAKKTPEYIQYLGKFLPSAVFGMLVIYCLKNVFLSIAGRTICYMLILYFL